MMTTDPHPNRTLETRLRSDAAAAAPVFAGARARFAARALAAGLVDVAYEDHDTPLGSVRLAATDAGIVRVGLPAEDPDAVLEQLASELSLRILHAHNQTLTNTRRELDEYFAGRLRRFEIPLDWSLTKAFRRQVLTATARIPYGTTSTYRQIATDAGSPGAVRAAGSALAQNPLAILVPCHRVLRSDGKLGQYRGGIAAKTQLLKLEREA
jgi:methylated-DNA-[protein]-cysteine S-methyltransferase